MYRSDIGSYEHNQVVAFIGLTWDGAEPVVKAYYSVVQGQRFVRTFRRRSAFTWQGKLFENWFRAKDSSEDIRIGLRENILRSANPGNEFAMRYIDIDPFDRISPFVDWRSLLGLVE